MHRLTSHARWWAVAIALTAIPAGSGVAAAATYTWNVASGAWTASSSWTPARTTPASDDALVFDGAVTPSAAVTGVPTETIAQLHVTNGAAVSFSASSAVTLTIDGDGGDDFVVGAGASLSLNAAGSALSITIALPAGATGNVAGEMSVSGAGHRLLPTDAGAVTFAAGSELRTLTGFNGNVFGTSGANGVVVFESGSTYEHGAGFQPFGLTAPNSRVTFESGSLAHYLVGAGSGAFGGRTYGDCIWAPNPAIIIASGALLPVNIDNLAVLSGGFRNETAASITFNLKGNLTVTSPGVFEQINTAGTGTVNFEGTTEQAITGNGSIKLGPYSDLKVTNPAGLRLERYLFCEGAVTLSGGPIRTNGHLLHLGHVASTAGPQWVIGDLGMIMPSSAGNVARTFLVGAAARGAPVTIVFASVGDSGTVVARTDLGDHADLAASGLEPLRSANRVWTVTNLGMTFTTCDVTLGFDPADLDPLTDTDELYVGKREGGVWTQPTVGTRTATSTQATALTSFNDFVVAMQGGLVGVETERVVASTLAPARPTPFRLSTTLEYSLARAGDVTLAIYDVDGRRIRTLDRGARGAGVHRPAWDGRGDDRRTVAPGVYFVRLVTTDERFDRRLVKIR